MTKNKEVTMNEYFKTKAEFRKFYDDDTDNNYSGLVDGATYDILIKFGKDETQIPTKEMSIGLCEEIITIKDINTEKTYKYSSFNDAFNAWQIDEMEEIFLNGVDDMHDTYKKWCGPAVYVIASYPDDMFRIFEYLCECISCVPILASYMADKFVQNADYFKALSIEAEKVRNANYIIMGIKDGKKTKLMQIVENLAKDFVVPIIYTEYPYPAKKADFSFNDTLCRCSNNVNIESSENIKSEDLSSSLDN